MWRAIAVVAVLTGCVEGDAPEADAAPTCTLNAVRSSVDVGAIATGATPRPARLLIFLSTLDGELLARWRHDVAAGAFGIAEDILVADIPVAPTAMLEIEEPYSWVACRLELTRADGSPLSSVEREFVERNNSRLTPE